ncbi:hypothetical protein CTI14_15500, partial [Methylobacterium radiotolerans]
MMDGVCVGPVEKMFLTAQGIPDYGDIVPERDFPRNCLLKNFTAEYNYRQGMSGTGHYDLVIDGGRYAYTGRLPDGPGGVKKWTLPCAGIDLEAYYYFGWLCERTKFVNMPEITQNRGIGLLLENGTRHSMGDVWSHHNWGEGLLENGHSGTMDNDVGGIFEYNCNHGDPAGWYNAEVSRSGIRPTQRGLIRANRRNGGLSMGQPLMDPTVQGVRIIATDPREGEQCGHVLIQTGGQIDMDYRTGVFNGWVPGTDDRIMTTLPALGGLIMGNTVEDGTYSTNYLAAFQVDAPGARVIGNEVRKTTSAALGSQLGVAIDAAGYASGNSGPGYPTPVRVTRRARSSHRSRGRILRSTAWITCPSAAIHPPITISGSPCCLAPPDVLRYEVQWTVVYDALDADRVATYDLIPQGAPT